jgi:hypothetical protein
MQRWVAASKRSFVKPSSRPLAMARPEAAQGNTAFSNAMPFALGGAHEQVNQK